LLPGVLLLISIAIAAHANLKAAVLKALLHRLHGLPRWSVRPPLVEVSEAVEEHLAAEMKMLA
jgi:dihydrodipicolinate synthase/N-acetylneuraminate lyase